MLQGPPPRPLPRIVLERRYLAKDESGALVETPEELFRRVAHTIAQAEAAYVDAAVADRTVADYEAKFYDLITSLRFLPNSPTLGNAGRPLQQLSACFVLPVDDSMEGIFEALKDTALIHQSGGGTGFAFSRLRPAGDRVASTGGIRCQTPPWSQRASIPATTPQAGNPRGKRPRSPRGLTRGKNVTACRLASADARSARTAASAVAQAKGGSQTSSARRRSQ